MINHSSAGALAIFARPPVPGKAKTRLIPLLGARGAAGFQCALIADSMRKFLPMRSRFGLFLMPAGARAISPAQLAASGARPADACGFRIRRQRGRDLGARLESAFTMLLRDYPRAVVIGTDSPELTITAVVRAFRELLCSDTVLGPCEDGGYYLVGLRRAGAAGGGLSPLFHGVRWGTRRALRDTARNFKLCGLSCALLGPLADIDFPEDFLNLRRRMASSAHLRCRAPATWRFLRGFEPQLNG